METEQINQRKTEVKKKKYWLRGGVAGGIIGIVVHLAINLSPLIPGYLLNSQDILSLACLNCTYNFIRILTYLVSGMVIGIIIGHIYGKIKNKKQRGVK